MYYTHIPAGTSVKNTMHYVQLVKSGRFAMYDYGGSSENKKRYGTVSGDLNISVMHGCVFALYFFLSQTLRLIT